MKYKTHIKLVHEIHGTCLQCKRIKDQPIKFTSCINNTLHLFVLVTGRLH